MNSIKLTTKCGDIVGIDNGNYTEFRSIRYATAERFEYPVQVTGWEGTYDATSFKACSYQRRAFEDDAVCNEFYHNEFRRGAEFTYSEDCLFLNIWAPADAKDCPVMIYIHGGSFTGGSTDEPHLNGKAFAENGIVFVTMNYRLGPFGFVAHPDLNDESGIRANFGLYDQLAAMKWVKDNIAEFGGSPDKITLCGQSAGAMSVDIHLTNPMCKGWFRGAILMSGAALQRGLLKPLKAERAASLWDEVMKNADVKTMQELKEIDAKKLFYAWQNACKAVKLSALATMPVYDEKLLCRSNFTYKALPDIPYIVGITSTDMVPAVLEGLAKKWAKSVNTCYTYLFARNLPGDDKGAWHACDLLYAFNTLDISWRPFDDTDRKISNEMLKSFAAFVKNGKPDCNEIPKWDSDKGDKALVFCEDTTLAKLPTATLIKNTITHGGFI